MPKIQLQPLRNYLHVQRDRSGRIATRLVEAGNGTQLDVDHQMELGRLHHWQVGRLLALKDPADVYSSLSPFAGSVSPIAPIVVIRSWMAPVPGDPPETPVWHLDALALELSSLRSTLRLRKCSG